MKIKTILSRLALILILAQVVLVLVSWLLNVSMPDLPMRSLLSNEGIRWIFGHFADNMLTPFLLWILLLSMAYGAVTQSGIHTVFPLSHLNYRQRLGLHFSIVFFIVVLVVVLLLTCMPQAILLSSSGALFPSSFSAAIIPLIAFVIICCSIIFGLVSGRFPNFQCAFSSLGVGVIKLAPFLPVYLLAAQLIASIRFVMMI